MTSIGSSTLSSGSSALFVRVRKFAEDQTPSNASSVGGQAYQNAVAANGYVSFGTGNIPAGKKCYVYAMSGGGYATTVPPVQMNLVQNATIKYICQGTGLVQTQFNLPLIFIGDGNPITLYVYNRGAIAAEMSCYLEAYLEA